MVKKYYLFYYEFESGMPEASDAYSEVIVAPATMKLIDVCKLMLTNKDFQKNLRDMGISIATPTSLTNYMFDIVYKDARNHSKNSRSQVFDVFSKRYLPARVAIGEEAYKHKKFTLTEDVYLEDQHTLLEAGDTIESVFSKKAVDLLRGAIDRNYPELGEEEKMTFMLKIVEHLTGKKDQKTETSAPMQEGRKEPQDDFENEDQWFI